MKSNTLATLLGVLIFALVLLVDQGEAEQCGIQVQHKSKCAEGFCCSTDGWCGTTDAYCGKGHCQSQCLTPSPPPPPPPPIPPSPIKDIISETLFNEMLKNRNNGQCPARGFYTYYSFIEAARSFPNFGNTGSVETRKREIAAFFGQTSQETNGVSPGGPYEWGYCFKAETGSPDSHCVYSKDWPCAPGKKYYGRGPIQLSYNFNYGLAGQGLNLPLLSNPDLVEANPVISFKTAIWFWMTPQGSKPSSHEVIIGQWKPSSKDTAEHRVPGYGLITNIINGGVECGKGVKNPQVENRIGYYKRYCDLLHIDSYGDNLDCYHQCPYSGCTQQRGLFSS